MPPVSDMEGVLRHAGAQAAMSRLNLRNPRTGEEYPSRLEPRRHLPDFLQAGGRQATANLAAHLPSRPHCLILQATEPSACRTKE